MKKKRIAIDADFIIFQCTEGKEHTQGTFENEKVKLKPFKEKFHAIVRDIEEEVAVEFLGVYKIKGKAKVLLSDPKGNFRYDIFSDYKANRKGSTRSELFYRLRKWALKEYGYASPYSQEKVAKVLVKAKVVRDREVSSDSPLYHLYGNMTKRCYRKDSHSTHYKAQGIKVYKTWAKDRSAFFDWCKANGYKEGLTIDRIDGDWHYIPSNCQFISDKDNKLKQHFCDNRRHYISYDLKFQAHTLRKAGESWKAICEMLDIPYGIGKNTKQGKTQMRLCKSYETDKDLYKYPTEKEWVASKLSEGVVFMLDGKEFIVQDGKPELSFRMASREADDDAGYLAGTGKYIVCSMDKDVLKSTAGDHFDVYHSCRGIVTTSELEARNFTLLQTVMGDPTDGIVGIPRVGEKTAIKLLDKHGWNWEGVLLSYKVKGLTDADALLNRRLVDLHQWTPKKGIRLIKL